MNQRSRRSWPGTVAVAAVLVMLGVGLPLADNQVTGGYVPLPAGGRVQVGPLGAGDQRPVSVEVPDGWILDAANSSLSHSLALRSGMSVLQLNVVQVEGATPEQLWEGMQRVEQASGLTARHGVPYPIHTDQGIPGLIGPITLQGGAALVAVFAAPALGADVIVAGPPEEILNAEIGSMLTSIRFAGGGT